MKKSTFSLITIVLFSCVFAQAKRLPKRLLGTSRDMKLVPGGTINLIDGKNNKSNQVIYGPFYISKQITNKEYKEFVNEINLFPDKKLVGNKTRRIESNGQFRDSTLVIQYSEVVKGIIDLNKVAVKDYFSNEKYDNYPALGVSDEHAKYYAAWKSRRNYDQSNKKKPIKVLTLSVPNQVQKVVIDLKSLQPISKEQVLLNKEFKGDLKGFYLVAQAPQIIKK